MKHRYLLAGILCCCLVVNARAQLPGLSKSPDKLLFSRLPETFTLSNSLLDTLFADSVSGKVTIPVSPGYFFKGVIADKVQHNPHVVTINIKLPEYDGALLPLSKITNTDFSTKYEGSIINIRYGDVFVLTHKNNTIAFIKKKQSVVITE